MLPLDSPDWADLVTAYGSAAELPALLRALDSVPNPRDPQEEPWFSIWSALAHQGDVYSASFAAVPHVVRVLSSAPERAGSDYFSFPAWVDICRHRKDVEIPEDLEGAYHSALYQLPALAGAAGSRPWDEDMLRSVLAAVAVANGQPNIAEVVLELNSSNATELLRLLAENNLL
jgi:hypothetical protein